MPEAKKDKMNRSRARTHVAVQGIAGFRVQDLPKEEQAEHKRNLSWLEDRGMVTFVTGVGWVDTLPALVRYQRKMGLNDLLGQGLS